LQGGCEGGLFDRARAYNEDIHQSPGALLPVRAGRHVGDADQSPKQIDWIEVLAYVAALDRALHQCTNRFIDLSVRSFEHLLWISDQNI